MSQPHLLDYAGDAELPAGYLLITSEVDFLHHAVNAQPLLLRGESVCNWAKAFYQARNQPYREIQSPVRALQELCPNWNQEDLRQIQQALGTRLRELQQPFTAKTILQNLYPNRLWDESPSEQHAAQYLQWLFVTPIENWLQPLLQQITQIWRQNLTNLALSTCYNAHQKSTAQSLLQAWLGLPNQAGFEPQNVFPLEITSALEMHMQQCWREHIIQTQAQYIPSAFQKPLPPAIYQLITMETLAWAEHNPHLLTNQLAAALSPYLDYPSQQRLAMLRPPAEPSPMPIEPTQILTWFTEEYFPYCLWAEKHQPNSTQVQALAHDFAIWYLQNYPAALTGSKLRAHLAFNKVATVIQSNETNVLFIIVADGLHWGDTQTLHQLIQKHAPRLTPIQHSQAFAALPTITEFCKTALLNGAPPLYSMQPGAQSLAPILSQRTQTQHTLATAKPGETYFWRIQEPDTTYHKENSSPSLPHNIHAQLQNIATQIGELVKDLPPQIPLQIIITSDHGRLLAESTRKISPPNGWEAHGRTAWGQGVSNLPEEGYQLQGFLATLSSHAFQTPHHLQIPLNRDSFKTKDGKSGSERYPHGGISPEEIIVPWLVYQRDLALPKLHITLSGSGQAGTPGILTLQISNLSDIPIQLNRLHIKRTDTTPEETLPIHHSLAARQKHTQQIAWDTWLTPAQKQTSRFEIEIQLPNGTQPRYPIQTQLHSTELYHQENILEGLDL